LISKHFKRLIMLCLMQPIKHRNKQELIFGV